VLQCAYQTSWGKFQLHRAGRAALVDSYAQYTHTHTHTLSQARRRNKIEQHINVCKIAEAFSVCALAISSKTAQATFLHLCATTGQEVAVLEGHPEEVYHVEFLQDDSYDVAAEGAEGTRPCTSKQVCV
jgi:hypothetical protein